MRWYRRKQVEREDKTLSFSALLKLHLQWLGQSVCSLAMDSSSTDPRGIVTGLALELTAQ